MKKLIKLTLCIFCTLTAVTRPRSGKSKVTDSIAFRAGVIMGMLFWVEIGMRLTGNSLLCMPFRKKSFQNREPQSMSNGSDLNKAIVNPGKANLNGYTKAQCAEIGAVSDYFYSLSEAEQKEDIRRRMIKGAVRHNGFEKSIDKDNPEKMTLESRNIVEDGDMQAQTEIRTKTQRNTEEESNRGWENDPIRMTEQNLGIQEEEITRKIHAGIKLVVDKTDLESKPSETDRDLNRKSLCKASQVAVNNGDSMKQALSETAIDSAGSIGNKQTTRQNDKYSAGTAENQQTERLREIAIKKAEQHIQCDEKGTAHDILSLAKAPRIPQTCQT